MTYVCVKSIISTSDTNYVYVITLMTTCDTTLGVISLMMYVTVLYLHHFPDNQSDATLFLGHLLGNHV